MNPIQNIDKEIQACKREAKSLSIKFEKIGEGKYESKLPFKIEGDYILNGQGHNNVPINCEYNTIEQKVLIEIESNEPSLSVFISKDEAVMLKAIKEQLSVNSFKTRPAFVIGPAGTGKTTVSVESILLDLKAGLKVAVLSNTNMAVENIIERLPQEYLQEGKAVCTIKTEKEKIQNLSPSAIKANQIKPIEDEIEVLKEVQKTIYKTKRDAQPMLDKVKNQRASIDAIISNISHDLFAMKEDLKVKEDEIIMLNKRIDKLKHGWIAKFQYHANSKIEELKLKQEMLSKETVDLRAKIEQQNNRLNDQNVKRKAIEAEHKEVSAKINETKAGLKEISQRLRVLAKEREKIETENVYCDAKLIGATLFGASLNKKIQQCDLDKIYVDEASMATIPLLLCATQNINDKPLPKIEYEQNDKLTNAQNKAIALALKSKLIIIGDPKQLPPIAKTFEMRQSVYDMYEVEKIFTGEKVENTVFLDTNLRNHPHITKMASKLFYKDMLISGKPDTDTYALYVRQCSSRMVFFNKSYVNYGNMKVVIEQTAKALEKGRRDIGIITPYREQAKLIEKNLKTLLVKYPDAEILVGTIHTFQGKEKEIIIYDLTYSPDIKVQVPAMYKGDKNSVTAKLLNVAMTRAKDFFIVIGNVKEIICLDNSLILQQWVKGINDIYERNRYDNNDNSDVCQKVAS